MSSSLRLEQEEGGPELMEQEEVGPELVEQEEVGFGHFLLLVGPW